MIINILLIIAFGGAFLVYLAGKISGKLRNILSIIISLVILTLIVMLQGKEIEVNYFHFFNFPLMFRINVLSWFFALLISFLTTLSLIFSLNYMKGKENLDFYYLMLLLVNASMLAIVLSGDLLSFYIFWETMSWSTFLLISYNKGKAINAALKYIIMSIAGSLAMLLAIILIYIKFQSFDILFISTHINMSSQNFAILIFLLLSIGFGVKSAIVPLHAWLPDAHAEAPSPFSAILSGILIKMGIYGFLLLFYVILGLKILLSLNIWGIKLNYIFALLGAISVLVPSMIAIFQTDAKRVLAWSSIGQIGYIAIGITIGSSIGTAGGLFHLFSHTIFKALLFFSIAAVEYRTGTRDLNKLGGLMKKMPIVFIGCLISVLGLIGIPLTNGFVSKWLIYKALFLNQNYFLLFIALISTWAAILYGFKILHHIFLGQLSQEHIKVKKAPLGMQIPIMILSFLVLLFGIFPGLALKTINKLIVNIGFKSLSVNLFGIVSETGPLNIINIFAGLMAILLLIIIVFKLGKKKTNIKQDDNYAAGSYIPIDKYHFTSNFYAPLFGIIKPLLIDHIDNFYLWVANRIRSLSDKVRKIYCGNVNVYVIYIIGFAALLIILKIGLKLW
ncbi:hypothetical protein J7L48_07240 [bacterium]|nr:hypothetical protein [bacterium]